ncbi:MAG: AAA family ATPase, partial [Oscillospiraceae bacterium]|nr:AAA family ATPase [Oscillospiraceae bacterium]
MKEKIVYYCTECGNETPKWEGRCRVCGAWNTITEQPLKKTASTASSIRNPGPVKRPQRLKELSREEDIRFTTGMSELDRVLGGGAVRGSLVLFGGAPGIGKSTLLLQICQSLCQSDTVLYVTGEESEKQISMRANRLGVSDDNLFVLAETALDDILSAAESL